jgi:hypothetical protein
LEYIKSIKRAAKDRLAADAKKLLVAAKSKSTEDTKAPEPVVEEDSKAKLKREKTEKTTRKRAKKILLAVK